MLFFLAACAPSGLLGTIPPDAPTDPEPVAPLSLEVTSPAAFAFVGDAVEVTGRVNHPDAIVWVEGHRVNVGSAGAFRVTVPVDRWQRHLDIEASHPTAHLRERRPVLSGVDPMTAWPGAMTLRFTPTGVDHLAELVEGQIVALDIAGQLTSNLPSIEVGGFSATPIGIDHYPITASMVAGDDGLSLTITAPKVELIYAITSGTFLGDGDVVLGFDAITLGGALHPTIDAAGVLGLELTDTTVDLGEPILTLGGIGSPALESLIGGAVGSIAGFLEGTLDTLVGGIGRIDLFGPIGFELDLLGTPIAISVDRLDTDAEGVAAVVGVDLGTGTNTALRVPTADEAGVRADLAVAIHEGLFQPLLQSELLDLLDLDLELSGILGEVLGLPIRALPGGDALPDDVSGFCLGLDVGPTRVVRLADGIAPLATIVLPELLVDIGVNRPTSTCEDWLDVSLAVEADLAVTRGTVLGIDLRVVDGLVVAYATDDAWTEQDVVVGLGDLIAVATSLIGGSLEIDLADLIGGLPEDSVLGDLNPRILDSVPATNEAGEAVPGLRVMTLSLWD